MKIKETRRKNITKLSGCERRMRNRRREKENMACLSGHNCVSLCALHERRRQSQGGDRVES